MGMFSNWIDNNVQPMFGQDAAGQLAFFPHGWRRSGYYIEASDEGRIKPLVAMYTVAAAVVGTVGSTCTIAFLVLADHARTWVRTLESGLIAYAIFFTLLYVLPMLLLWKTYRILLARLCSSLAAVGPEAIRGSRAPHDKLRQRIVLILLLGVLLFAVAVAVRYGH
jgi:hypothetical protein